MYSSILYWLNNKPIIFSLKRSPQSKGPDEWKVPESRKGRTSQYFVGSMTLWAPQWPIGATLGWSSEFSLLVFPVDFLILHLAGGLTYPMGWNTLMWDQQSEKGEMPSWTFHANTGDTIPQNCVWNITISSSFNPLLIKKGKEKNRAYTYQNFFTIFPLSH